MKVLLVSKSMVAGTYHGKLRELAKLGVDLTVIVPPRWGKERLEISDAPDYEIRVVPCTLSGHSHFYFYTQRIDVSEFDLVQLEEEPWSTVTYQIMRLAKKAHKPAIFFSWQNIHKNFPPPFNLIERHSFRHGAAAIVGNDEARGIIKAKGFSKPIFVIPQVGVDPEVFKRSDVSHLRRELKLEGKFVIGYIGRLIEAKGIADLLRAIALLPDNCVVTLVGDGPFRNKAEKLASQLGIARRVTWVRQVNSYNVPQYMNLIDVLALPSRTWPNWKEQFGRVLIEAMACEKPVVGSDSGEIPTVIGDAGLIFHEGNVNALADHLRNLAGNADLRRTFATKGRQRVLDRFTHRKIAQQTVEAYSSVLSTSVPSIRQFESVTV